MLLVGAAQCYTRGKAGYKSKVLKKRRYGNTAEVITYADKANGRLRRKYYRMVLGQKQKAQCGQNSNRKGTCMFPVGDDDREHWVTTVITPA